MGPAGEVRHRIACGLHLNLARRSWIVFGRMNSDRWLDRWLPLIHERAGSAPILELGCGRGEDTAVLAGAGCQVVSIDLSSHAIAEAKARVPEAEYYCQDIRDQWPLPASETGVVVASLSLHYFAWDETSALVERIGNALRQGGVLLCRLNSTNDHNHGASGHPRIAENFYSVNGKPKRFFSSENITTLFGKGWHALSVSEMVIHRYREPKSVWEVVVERIV